jgi:KDO2-lipid IV(A) lauroyltransferase|tara:strand:- start:200 stop:1060 length:861 start_codon:yes stop_codon:yes gene_type:complete
MKQIKYLIQFVFIYSLFIIFKLIGLKLSSTLSSKIAILIGPFFRSKNLISSNILKAFPNLTQNEINIISKNMWSNYGRILSEYVFIKDIRKSKIKNIINIKGQKILEKIKEDNKPVIFISGHFNNFELMAMHIEKSGINLAAVYRPLNNIFLNFLMEKIRKKYICKNQIKKGLSGTRELIKCFKNNISVALMIDQRVSQGIKSNFFGQAALTTTIPAQFVKKYNCTIVPVYIERKNNINFKITIHKPLEYKKDDTIENITLKLNILLEKMIRENPDQWIWSHNRWK